MISILRSHGISGWRDGLRITASFKVGLRAVRTEFGIELSQPNHLGIVQGQTVNCGAAARGQADDLKRGIHGPLEVIVPRVQTRMEQRHGLTGGGVHSIEMIQLATVANRAGEGQVCQRSGSAATERQNMIQFKTSDLKPTGQQAILAPFARPLNDRAAEWFRSEAHRQAPKSGTASRSR